MATDNGSDGPPGIGSVLKQTRERQELDIKTVEERTKIRIKYLRALENEDWDVLPNPAYARAFLRAYADLLGLDGEVLVDDYRHSVEHAASGLQGLSEPLLEGRGGTDRRRMPRIGRGPLIGLGLAAIVVVLLVIGLLGGGGDGGENAGSGGKHAAKAKHRHQAKSEGGGASGAAKLPPGAPKTVTLKLSARTDTQVCVLDARDNVLVPGQVITGGSEDGPYVSQQFTVKLDPAQANLLINSRRSRVAKLSTAPAAYRVTPQGVTPITYTGPTCP
jgi:Helix-turn-helix domain